VPPPPKELQGQEMKVEYISLLAQAQKMVGTQAVDSAVQFAASMAALWPTVLDKIDADEAVDIRADLMGVQPGVIRTDDEVAALRQERAKREQALAANQSIAAAAQTAKTLSETKTEDKNALTDLMSGGALG
jgi:hypothetical protein